MRIESRSILQHGCYNYYPDAERGQRFRNCLGPEVKVLISAVINIFMPTYLLLMHYKYINCTVEAASMFHFHTELDRGL